uniref:Uncharacterized protein n=1 Tax=Magallana gigas TaxID=29159 RepID=K1S2D5_MAGGI
MTSVAYSYMTLDTVAHGGVPGNRKSSAYRQPHSRESSVTSGSLSRNYSSKKRKKRKSENKNKESSVPEKEYWNRRILIAIKA